MIELRSYQNTAYNSIRNFFLKGGKHCILQAATGSGKTVIFSRIAADTVKKNKKIVIFTDRYELLMQSFGSLKKFNVQAFLIQAGQTYVSKSFNSFIAMSQTFRRRIDKEYWQDFLKTIDLVIIDEAHKQEFNYLFESKLLDDKYVIGFTATPLRSGKMRQLAFDYEKIIETVSIKELINKGYLVNDDYYGISNPDLSNVEIDKMKDDYKISSLFNTFDKPALYDGLIDNYKKIAPRSKTLIFCVNIEHAIKTAIRFKDEGFKVKYIASKVSKPKLPKDYDADKKDGVYKRYEERKKVYDLYQQTFTELSGDRRDVMKEFEDNEFQILVNADILTTGYDCPDIETIGLNRATKSVALLLQMLGRGSRPAPGKTHFNILDMGGNCERLGFYTEDRKWSLWHEQSKGGGLPPLKNCGYRSNGRPIDKGGCKRLILASYKICPFCGFKYPDKKKKKVDLYSSYYDRNKGVIRSKKVTNMSHQELYAYFVAKKHKTAWLWRQLWYRGRENEIRIFGKKHNWRPKTIKTAINFCKSNIN